MSSPRRPAGLPGASGGEGAEDGGEQGASGPPARTAWQRWGWILRWGGTAAGVAYVAHVVDGASLKGALLHARVPTMLLALAVVAIGLGLGAARWRALLRAYGAQTRPPLGEAVRLYFIAVFYNTYLPGGVAGDLLRAVVTRRSFGLVEAGGEGGRAVAEAEGATAAVAVVMIERALGLLGVVTLVAVGLASVGPQVTDTGALWMWSAIGAGAALGGVLLLPLGRRLAPWLPGPLGKIAQRLPVMSRWGDFAIALLLSLLTQLATAVAGWLFLRDLHAGTTLLDALFIVPLAAATVFLPITVGGTGAREAVFIALCGQLLGMSSGDALAASLLLWATSLISGALGGLLQLGRARGGAAHAK